MTMYSLSVIDGVNLKRAEEPVKKFSLKANIIRKVPPHITGFGD